MTRLRCRPELARAARDELGETNFSQSGSVRGWKKRASPIFQNAERYAAGSLEISAGGGGRASKCLQSDPAFNGLCGRYHPIADGI
jgi:hypothetical protein